MSEQLEYAYTLDHVQKTNEETEFNFRQDQLEVKTDRQIHFDLVQSGNGGLFIFEIYLDGYKIGSAWSKSRKLLPKSDKNYFIGPNYSNEQTPAFFYSTRKVFNCPKLAMKASQTTKKNPYCFDEYWWDEDTCDDAWFPTFDTLQQLLDFHIEFEKEIGIK